MLTLPIKKTKKRKVYDFKYKIFWKNGGTTDGYVTGSELAPEEIFLTNTFTYFAKGTCTYFNKNEIRQLEIFDLVEKVDHEL